MTKIKNWTLEQVVTNVTKQYRSHSDFQDIKQEAWLKALEVVANDPEADYNKVYGRCRRRIHDYTTYENHVVSVSKGPLARQLKQKLGGDTYNQLEEVYKALDEPIEYQEIEGDGSTEEGYTLKDTYQKVYLIIELYLDKTEQFVIKGMLNEETQEAIGEVLGISPSRVSQIYNKATDKIAKILEV